MSHEAMEAMIATWGEQLRFGAALDAASSGLADSGLADSGLADSGLADSGLAGEGPSRHVVFCGMGGSGIAGDFASVVATCPVTVHKGYGLPRWVDRVRPLVVAVSYSGNTEETLSAVEAAATAGLSVACVSGGGQLSKLAARNRWPLVTIPIGLQPRAALGYLLGGAIAVLRGAEAVTADTDLGAAAELADTILRPDGAARQLAIDLSEGLVGRMVGIYGSMGVTAPTAQRWKTQINENAKWPAWWSLLPELDHNEIVSWSALSDLTRRKVGIVTLRDRDEGPRVEARFRHTASVTEDDVAWVGEVWAQGDTALERMVSLAIVGDLVSLELARLAGVDPVPVDAIEDLKRKLSEE